MTVVLFTAHAPDTLSDELTRHSHEVYEALVISEVLSLADTLTGEEVLDDLRRWREGGDDSLRPDISFVK